MTTVPATLPSRPIVAMLGLALAGGLLAACGSSPSSAPSADTTTSAGALPVPAATGLVPRGEVVSGAPVLRVVDGDTIHVDVDGRDVDVRLIGINTPETVKPGSPVECFGPEASDFAHAQLEGRTVTLEFDDSQGTTDKYGRTLAYVWIEESDGALRLFNLDAVEQGYAEERQYGPQRFAWQDVFRDAERRAQAAGLGLWGACASTSGAG